MRLKLVVAIICALAMQYSMANPVAALMKQADKDLKQYGQGYMSTDVPAKGRLEVAFSPNEGSEALVLKVINDTRREILMLSYSFTSANVVNALLDAVHRGVTVRLVADKRNNLDQDPSGKARAALSALKNAGADIKVISRYPIHHDKVIISDRKHVELGSFNYSSAAAEKNSENVLVNWDNPELAAVYMKHFDRNYLQATSFGTQY